MSLLASLTFVIAAVVAIAAVWQTLGQYSGIALANISDLRSVNSAREFRFQTVVIVARPAADGEVVRIKPRIPAPRRISSLAGLRAAA